MNNLSNLTALLGSQTSQNEFNSKQMAITTMPSKPSPFVKDKFANMDQTSALLSKYAEPTQNNNSLSKVNSHDILKMTQEAMMERQKKRVQSDDDEQDTGPIIKRKTNNEDITVNFKSTSSSNQPASSSNSVVQKGPSGSSVQSTALQKTSKLQQKVTQKNTQNAQRDQQNIKSTQNGSSSQANKPPQSQMLQKKPVPNSSYISSNLNKGQIAQNPQQKKLPTPSQGNQQQNKQPLQGKQNNQTPVQQHPASSQPQQRQTSTQSTQSKPGQQKPGQQKPGQQKPGQQKPVGAPQGQARPQTPGQKPPQNGNPIQRAVSQQSGVKPPVKRAPQQKPPPNSGAQQGKKQVMLKDLSPAQKLVQLQIVKKKLEELKKRTPEQNQKLQQISNAIGILQKKLKPGQTGQQGKPKNQQQGTQVRGAQGQKQQLPNKAPVKTLKQRIEECKEKLIKLNTLKQRNPQQEQAKQNIEKFLQKIKQQTMRQQQEKDSKLNQDQKRKVQEQRDRMLKLEQDRRRQKMMMMKRNQGNKRREYEEEDDYDYTDGFIVEDDLELNEEYREELDKITNKKKIRRLAKKYDNVEIRESGMDFIQHEEYRSKVIGRQEDLEEEKKLKREKIERQKRKGFAVDSDDDIDIDEDDDDEDEEEEGNEDEDEEEIDESLENFIVDEVDDEEEEENE